MLVLGLVGCGGGTPGNFTSGLDLDRCEDTFPVCTTTAGCVLTENDYIEGEFPGQRAIIVPAPAEAVIHIDIFFVEQRAAGVDTDIRWHEPGCFDTYRWTSGGQDIFLDAGRDRVLTRSQQVFQDGDHLVEIFSDAIADYFIRARVDAPEL